MECEKYKYYTFYKEEKKYICNNCGKTVSTRFSNMKRHYERVHKMNITLRDQGSESEVSEEEPNVLSQAGNNQFLRVCLSLLKGENIPLRKFDEEAFFKVLFEPHKRQIGKECVDVAKVVEYTSTTIRQILAKKLRNQLVSIKVDTASRMNQSILVINVHYIYNFKMRINTLGIIQLQDWYTAEFLRDEIMNYLQPFEIDISQIYSITTDNGANVPNGSKMLQELDQVAVSDNQSEDLYDTCVPALLASVMSVVRCAGQSIQLAANDVLTTLEDNIRHCRTFVTALQALVQASDSCAEMPLLDNGKSWISTFDMLSSIMKLKPLIDRYSEEEIIIDDLRWEFITAFLIAFAPLAKCTRSLQCEQYVIGDFYRDWLTCELELEDLTEMTPYAAALHQAMENRKKTLLQNDAFLGALYMDPRFNFEYSTMLSEDQKIQAVVHLVGTYNLLNSMEANTLTEQQTVSLPLVSLSDSSNCSADALGIESIATTSAYAKLQERINNMANNTRTTARLEYQTFKEKLIALAKSKQVPLDCDILSYWKIYPADDDIKSIVQIALALPATQVSVERAFSALSVIVTKLQSNMTPTTLNDLLVTKLNYELYRSTDTDLTK